MPCVMNGVKKLIRRFHSQFVAFAIAIARARYRDGYSSATIAHTIGPQVIANPVMNRQAKTAMVFPAAAVLAGAMTSSEKCPTNANTIKQMNIQIPPVMRDLRRPKWLMTYRPPKVVPKLTPPRIICVTYTLLMPAPLKIVAPFRRGSVPYTEYDLTLI